MFWLFGHKACGILAPQPGIKPTPPELEGEVLPTGPPGKSHNITFKYEFKKPRCRVLAQVCFVKDREGRNDCLNSLSIR